MHMKVSVPWITRTGPGLLSTFCVVQLTVLIHCVICCFQIFQINIQVKPFLYRLSVNSLYYSSRVS